ncbi:hypothetical protein NE235_02915 [Actinoallomurus spadix]|uniref:Uncharacterized protein n=1 Tax=Actinoallomurus spadix TaxID=79912 RepID=A0ABP3HCV2_9ACTN|nr:hypothetical protein [Actinoallomurus spadix]MCO5985055.1 hypothetical protein [Actinoallomurus spadix]
MGDPGLPIMAGALAVPVTVLLLVLVFALMGRRWVLTGPDAAVEDDEARYEDDALDPTPYRPALEPPRAASPGAYDAYGPAPGYGSVPAAHESHGPGRRPYAAPPPREPYERPAREPYAPPRPSELSDWEPYVPAPRRSPEPSSRFPAVTDSYAAAPRDLYAPPHGDPYGAGVHSSHGSPAACGRSPMPPRTDRPEPPARPDSWEDGRRFPYGPYDAR